MEKHFELISANLRRAAACASFAIALPLVAMPFAAQAESLAPEDILGQAQASVPFAQQSGYIAEVMGAYPNVNEIPETGIQGAALPNGETLRLGKVADPLNPARAALAFQLAPNDPMTSSSKRSEIEFPPNIELDRVYWIAFSMFVYDWGTLPEGDESLLGTQVHSADWSRGLSPSFTLASFRNNTLQLSVQYSNSSSPTPSNTVSQKYPEIPIPFGRWVDFAFKFRESQSSAGFLQAWMDGVQIADYHGPLGYSTPGYKDYAKFGYYNWSDFRSSRKMLMRSPMLVLDPTGNKYQPADLLAYVQAH